MKAGWRFRVLSFSFFRKKKNLKKDKKKWKRIKKYKKIIKKKQIRKEFTFIHSSTREENEWRFSKENIFDNIEPAFLDFMIFFTFLFIFKLYFQINLKQVFDYHERHNFTSRVELFERSTDLVEGDIFCLILKWKTCKFLYIGIGVSFLLL